MKKILLLLLISTSSVYAVNVSDNLVFYASYMRADEWSYHCINETGNSFNICMDLYYNYAKPKSIKMMRASALAMQKRYKDKKRAEQLELENLRKAAIEKEKKSEERLKYLINLLDKQISEGD